MEKDTIGEGNPRSRSQTSSSIQRTLIHMDTQRVGQSRTQNMLEEKLNKLKDINISMRQLSIKRSKSSTTSKSCANGPFSRSDANGPFSRSSDNDPFSKTVQDRQCGKMDKLFCPQCPSSTRTSPFQPALANRTWSSGTLTVTRMGLSLYWTT